MRRLCQALVLPGALALQPLALAAETRPDPVPLFAICTGRLSAVMEFQWLFQDARADATQIQRDALAEVLAASTTPETQKHAMALRVQAKEAQRQILMLTMQQENPARARWAAKRATALLAECRALMVS